MTPRTTSVATALLAAALLALGCAFGLQKLRSFDYWWHLRTGALIAETGSVPRVDPYTYTVAGSRWIDIHWLFQLGLHAVHSVGGTTGVVVAKAAFIVALLAVLATIGWRRERPVVTALGLALMLLVAADRFMPRPELPSFLLLAGVLALLERHERRGDAWVYAIVPLQLVWVNVHGLFALGIVLCAIHLCAELLRPALQARAPLRPARARRLAAVTLLAVACSVVNPNGLDGALYPVTQLGMIGPTEDRGIFGSIAELMPLLDPRAGLSGATLLCAGLLATVSLAGLLANWRHFSGAHPLAWVAFGYLALGAHRNLALFAIVAAPIAVRNWNEVLDRHPLPRRVSAGMTAATLLVLAGWTVDVGRGSFSERMGWPRAPGLGVHEIFHPIAAAEWIARERPPGPIAHHMADGGYLIWRLYPEYRVLVDGRLEVFGPERFTRLGIGRLEQFQELDREHRFGAVIVHYALLDAEALLWWLHLNSNWRLVALDEVAALYVRVAEDGSPQWPELDVDAPDLFPARDAKPGFDDRMRRRARAYVLYCLHRYERALAEWQGLLERYPDAQQGRLVHAMMLQSAGFGAAAEAVLRQLLGAAPEDPELLTWVAELRQRAGDPEAARQLYERALAADPRFVNAALGLGLLAEAEGDLPYATLLYRRVVSARPPYDPRALAAARRLAAIGPP